LISNPKYNRLKIVNEWETLNHLLIITDTLL
jgi:hypothetical protein